MKNKIYVFCLSADGKFTIYNILKCDKIFELKFTDNYLINYNKIIDTITQYDTVTLKSWFTLDIKLGVITITFNKSNCFNNSFNFDQDYLEKIIEKTDNFKNILNPKNFNFNQMNENDKMILSSSAVNAPNKPLVSSNLSGKLNNTGGQENLSNSFNKKDNTNANFKLFNLGNSFIKSLFYTFVNDSLLEIKDFLNKNFNDKKDFLIKNYFENLKSSCSFETEIRININQDIYLFGCEDEILKCSAYLKEFKHSIKSIEFIRDFSHADQVIFYLMFNNSF